MRSNLPLEKTVRVKTMPYPENPKRSQPHLAGRPDEEESRVMIRRDKQKEPTLWTDLWELTKPEISFLVAISAVAGFLLGSTNGLDWLKLLHTVLGVCLTSAGGAILNHYIERDYDALMHRTARRPLPAGRLSPLPILVLGCTLALVGIGYTFVWVNLVTTLLAAITVVLYVAVYTPLKRITHYNTLVGTIPGALPALGGWTAATGSFDLGGWLMFGILLTWQMPHFLAVSWMYRKDYERGGFKMLSVTEPTGRATIVQTVLFTALTVGLSLSLLQTGLVGGLYISGAVLLGSYFLVTSIRFYMEMTHQHARKVLLASVLYIPALLLCLVLDRLL